jgi:RNA polymerase sigma-70 factor (ECF subfamily)
MLGRSMASTGGTVEFRQQIGEMLPRLTRFALVLARSRQDADDMVQRACERALERSDQFSPDTRLDRWLFRILHSVWLNELRARNVRRQHWIRERLAPPTSDGGANRLDATLMLRQVLDIVMELPDEQRSVLLLVGVEGLTYREASETLGVPIGTIMSRLARARLALMDRIAAKEAVAAKAPSGAKAKGMSSPAEPSGDISFVWSAA